MKFKTWLPMALAGFALFGLFVRLYHISLNQFLFYDEGMYLGFNRGFMNLVANNPPHNIHEFFIILGLMSKMALATPKSLWFLLLNLRVFWFGPEAWAFARWVSAFCGLATVVLLYFWAKRHTGSKKIALLSALFLWILPSHVFYSRLGMQESLSTLLFLSAVYLYMAQEKITWRFFFSAFLLSCVYFTNYRMIVAPIFIGFLDVFNAFAFKKIWRWPKTIIYGCVFGAIVVFFSGLDNWANARITLAWMFHQAADAGSQLDIVNFLSFPLYTFILEGFFFAGLFWASLYLIYQRQWTRLLPFGMVLIQMGMFSFAAEKGARYLCVVLPFMACAAAVALEYLWQQWPQKRNYGILAVVFALALAGMGVLSTKVALSGTDYGKAVHFVAGIAPKAVIVSTQPTVERLYVQDEGRVVPCPKDLGLLVAQYKKGARYLIIDPQVYVSWTADGQRFSPPLINFLEFTRRHVPPIRIFSHLDAILLTRLVMDHNENLRNSLGFLAHAKSQGYGHIYIYDLKAVFAALAQKHSLFLQ